MKKITLILTAFILFIGVPSYAQEGIPAERNSDQVEYNDGVNDIRRAKKGNKKRFRKRAQARKRANQRQIRAMRRVARADGNVSPREKAVIKKERRKMRRNQKRAFKRRAVKRKQRLGRIQDTPQGNR